MDYKFLTPEEIKAKNAQLEAERQARIAERIASLKADEMNMFFGDEPAELSSYEEGRSKEIARAELENREPDPVVETQLVEVYSEDETGNAVYSHTVARPTATNITSDNTDKFWVSTLGNGTNYCDIPTGQIDGDVNKFMRKHDLKEVAREGKIILVHAEWGNGEGYDRFEIELA